METVTERKLVTKEREVVLWTDLRHDVRADRKSYVSHGRLFMVSAQERGQPEGCPGPTHERGEPWRRVVPRGRIDSGAVKRRHEESVEGAVHEEMRCRGGSHALRVSHSASRRRGSDYGDMMRSWLGTDREAVQGAHQRRVSA